jgi:hypothetical protein
LEGKKLQPRCPQNLYFLADHNLVPQELQEGELNRLVAESNALETVDTNGSHMNPTARGLDFRRGTVQKAKLFYGMMSNLCPNALLKNMKAKANDGHLGFNAGVCILY